MSAHPQSGVTTLLDDLRAGDLDARSRLFQKVYDETRAIAAGYLRGERPDFTLQPTDVVHESFLRLFGKEFKPENRNHFFGAAAKAMREVVFQHARERNSQKRGGGFRRVHLDEAVDYVERQNLAGEAVREALDRLAAIRPRQCQVITMRHFCLYTVPETAALLQVSEKTVRNDERFARAWLLRELAVTSP
jgi:RNA polymerase sigma factor (TIGR02999 family)